MAEVNLKKIEKTYPNGFKAVHGIDLQIKDGEFMVFVGPSGCAKSTTLRMIAGLEEITGGEIWIGDKLVNDLPSKDRGIAMVFQNYALYPHMTVYENMAFGLKMAKTPKDEIDRRVKEAAEKLEITNLLDRKPKEMSGGQRQRVAVGRAIVRKPDVFLFDEPLSNLDAKLRVSMRVKITQLHKQLKEEGQTATMIYVTHDQEEALTMSDTIVVMDKGCIQQIGTPEDIYNEPKNAFVADFIGESNIIDGVMVRDKLVKMYGREFPCLDGGFAENEPVDVVIRPEDVDIVPEGQGQLKGTVTSVTFKGMQYDIIVDFRGFKWLIQTTDHSPVGARIGIKIDPDGIHIMKKSQYSGMFGDYSSFSEEYEEMSDANWEADEEESEDEK